jgi:hypothetical protein
MSGMMLAFAGGSYGAAPVNTVAPVVSGTATVGQTLTTTNGTWTGSPAPSFTYQWQRTGVNIGAATSSTYVLVAADYANTIRCVVKATNSIAPSGVTANSNSTASVAGTAPVNTVAPSVSGTATYGQTLSSSTGTWTGTPTPTFTYQWQRVTTNISAATSSTYVLVEADIGKTIRCVVTATNAISAASANSNSTAAVSPPAVGTAFGGGYYGGQISTAGNSVADFNLIIGPVSSAESTLQYKNANSATSGATSVINGSANTAAIVAAGNSTVYPAGWFCKNLTVGGFSDWYMPAQFELEVFYFTLKPTTDSNVTSAGTNAYAVPARASNYTAGTPAQTSATAFQVGNAQAFASPSSGQNYWSSNERNSPYQGSAWRKSFYKGAQNYGDKNAYATRVRAVRKTAV